MARKKIENELGEEEEKTVPAVTENQTGENPVKSARGRKKKSDVSGEITPSSDVAEKKEKTQYELDCEEFDQPRGGSACMVHTLYDYENGRDGFRLCTRHIHHLVSKTENNYLKIGVLLNLIQLNHERFVSDKVNGKWQRDSREYGRWCVEEGLRRTAFQNIYDYAAYEFGFSKGSVNNFMNIAKRFSENYISLIDGSVRLLPEYEGYSVSQLIQFLPYTDEQIRLFLSSGQILPNMSCRFLRATLKKLASSVSLTDSEKKDEDVIEGQLAIQEDGSITEEMYQECDEFEAECLPDSSQCLFSYTPDDCRYDSIFEKQPEQGNIIGFTESYEKIFFSRITELFSQGYRIEINAVKQ